MVRLPSQGSSQHIIRAVMNDKTHLRDKAVVFRFVNSAGVYAGVVKLVETDGFWIESPALIEQMRNDAAWKAEVQQIDAPVFFVPTSSLMYVIVAKE